MRLSPSVPPGRVSTVTVTFGSALWKPAAYALAVAVATGSLPPASSLIVTGPLSLPELVPPLLLLYDEPPRPPEQAASDMASSAVPLIAVTLLAAVLRENILTSL
jgi:hypothetical protein